MNRIERVSLEEALSSRTIRAAIEEITAQSYANPDVLLAQEFQKNNTAYLSLASAGEVEAFFLVGWSNISVDHVDYDSVFLGLSAVRPALKGGRHAVSLYRAFFNDAAKRASSARPVTWWFHTASPIVAGVMWRIAPNIGPSRTGELSDRQLSLLQAIAQKHGFGQFQQPDHPFILRGVARARYSTDETARLASRESRHLSQISAWNIRESEGDRLLFIGFSESNQ
jgi:hypothetical protein